MILGAGARFDSYTTMSTLSGLAPAFKALGDPTRLRVFSLLRASCGPEGCASSDARAQRTLADLPRYLGVGLPTVSHHLKELRQAGLVTCERRGRRVHCSVNEALLRQIGVFLDCEGVGVQGERRPRPSSRRVALRTRAPSLHRLSPASSGRGLVALVPALLAVEVHGRVAGIVRRRPILGLLSLAAEAL